jgi:crossover junction endodeoxyribonuclease RusA
MDHIVIHLPFPISVNAAYVNNNKGRGRGRFKSKKLRQWLDDCDRMVQWADLTGITGWYRVECRLKPRKDKRRRDLSNFWKVVGDLLVARGMVEDDCFEYSLFITWDDEIDADCVVKIKKVERNVCK